MICSPLLAARRNDLNWGYTLRCNECILVEAWDAVKLTLPGGWLHLSFRGHRPYRFRSNDGNCSELAPGLMFDDFLSIPDAESLPFYPLVLKPVVCILVDEEKFICRRIGVDQSDMYFSIRSDDSTPFTLHCLLMIFIIDLGRTVYSFHVP